MSGATNSGAKVGLSVKSAASMVMPITTQQHFDGKLQEFARIWI
jgi:hypothetical protein